ncbi:MAG: VWA domain-containing protein [Elusimicrobiota bacterium]|nr:VWA domain-containing protein [Elusimicrobiota bacterium]
MSKFIDDKNLNVLTNADNTVWIKRYIFLTLGFFFLIVALARPQFGDKTEEVAQESATIIIALDISKSMLAQDVSPNRLERAKMTIQNIIAQSPGDKIGIIVFSGIAMWQCPLTYDFEAVKMFLQDISPEQLPIGGTQISGAIALAAGAFEANPSKEKTLILISDGEDHDSKIVEALKNAEDNGIKIMSIGIGTQVGSPIPENGSYLKDNLGRIVFTKLNSALLENAAKQTGGQYFEIGAGAKDISSTLIRAISDIEKNENGKTVRNSKADRFQIFLLLSVLSFAASVLIAPSRKRK